MKRMIFRRLGVVIVVAMLLVMALNYYLQVTVAQRDMINATRDIFSQVNQILSQNQVEAAKVAQDFAEKCLTQAKAAAYIVQYRPSIVENVEEIKKVAALLQVDELHLFSPEGVLYAGSEPKYFGFTFNSGEQMRFFLPMLEDRELELCQEITPNTAEGKLMQYAAVWREDGQGIVQIGMEPERVLEATSKNELSYIFFSLFTSDSGATLYAIDPETYEILGATDAGLMGRNLSDIGLNGGQLSSGGGFHAQVNGQMSYCVFEESDGVILGRVCTAHSLYHNVNTNSVFLACYLAIIGILMIYFIIRYLDRNIISAIASVNGRLKKIAAGNLHERVQVDTTPEFSELSGHINRMINSLLGFTDKLSSVLDLARAPIGVYEYSQGMEQVRVTDKVSEILGLTREEERRLLSDHVLFEEHLSRIRRGKVEGDQPVYRLPGEEERYVRMESFLREGVVLGIMMDVTSEIVEKQRIERERDEDSLTGLCTRRAFYARMEELFYREGSLGHAVIIMMDSDDLKEINDQYGHENGDRYLRRIAQGLMKSSAPHKVISRLSGDEYAVLIYGCESEACLMDYIGEIRRNRDQDCLEMEDGSRVPIRFSMGCAFLGPDGADYHALLRQADERMYQEKRRVKQERAAAANGTKDEPF